MPDRGIKKFLAVLCVVRRDWGFLFLPLCVSPIPSRERESPLCPERSPRAPPPARSPRSSSRRLPLAMNSVMMYTGSPTDATAYSARTCLCRSFFMACTSAWNVCWCRRSSAGWAATVGEAPGRQRRKNGSYCRSPARVQGQTQPGLQPSTLPGVSMRVQVPTLCSPQTLGP